MACENRAFTVNRARKTVVLCQPGADGSAALQCRSVAGCAAVGYTGSVKTTSTTGLSGFWNGKTWKLTGAV
jgi:hypothetical protein